MRNKLAIVAVFGWDRTDAVEYLPVEEIFLVSIKGYESIENAVVEDIAERGRILNRDYVVRHIENLTGAWLEAHFEEITN